MALTATVNWPYVFLTGNAGPAQYLVVTITSLSDTAHPFTLQGMAIGYDYGQDGNFINVCRPIPFDEASDDCVVSVAGTVSVSATVSL